MIEIPLTPGKVALVDDEDAALAASRWFLWRRYSASRTWYALRNGKRPDGSPVAEKLHRVVWARAHPGEQVPATLDHANGNGLDCRRDNIRAASRSQNSTNRRRRRDNVSGFVGVRLRRDTPLPRPWQARIVDASGRRRTIGYFATAEEAARARDAAARESHGEYASFNFPLQGERGARCS
jgi:hypothetical protein